jgi:hypothetical protein
MNTGGADRAPWPAPRALERTYMNAGTGAAIFIIIAAAFIVYRMRK